MNTAAFGTTGAQLAHDKADRYRSLGAFGKPAYQSHVQLRAMLKAKRGERVANYFARPTYDPDLGELRWTAEFPGAARGWHEMSGEEQAQGALELEVIRSGLMSFAQELRAQSAGQPGGAASFASLLDQATRVPAEGNFLYFVSGQPVIAFWGFEDQNGRSVDPAAQALSAKAASPAAQTVAAPPPVMATPLTAPLLDRQRRPWSWKWLRWLLWGLLLLALLALLFFGLRACAPQLGLTPPGLPPKAQLPDPISPALSGPPVPPLPRAGSEGRAAQEAQAGTGGGANPSAAADAAPSAEPPGGRATAVELSAPPDAAPSAPEARSDPPAPSDAKVPPSPTPPEDKAAQEPPAARTDPPSPGRPMALPDQQPGAAGKLGFLEGNWKAGDGLVDKRTKQPVDLSFKFGKDGAGELTLRRPDGTTCSGAVTGRMEDGKLGIQGSGSVPCSNGSSYGPPKIECVKESGGQTQCFGINPDKSRYFMGMQRQ